uniref:DNA replication ATP-dependent helicase/nuclease DNA2 n=1 Tax=Clastoptera arizonana TaxID=38151 RepID=A0A1B6CR65_9HEMI
MSKLRVSKIPKEDDNQKKISLYFVKSGTKKTNINLSSQNEEAKHDLFGQNTLSNNRVFPRSENSGENQFDLTTENNKQKSICLTNKNSPSKKLNANNKILRDDHIQSPDYVLPTPSKTHLRKIKKQGIKRKFDFSESGVINDNKIVNNPKIHKTCRSGISVEPNNECPKKDIVDYIYTLDTNSKRLNKIVSNENIENINFLTKKDNCQNWADTVTPCTNNDNVNRFKNNEHDIECNDAAAIESSVTSYNNSPNKINVDLLFNNSDIFDNIIYEEFEENQTLSLESCTKCQIVSVQPLTSCGELILRLKGTDDGIVTCLLHGAWATCQVNVGDFANVTAKPILDKPGFWIVDNNYGSFVLNPDTLISGTTLVGSVFCMRKTVLSDGYKGLDSDSKIMFIGSLLHTLLQEVLKIKASSHKDIFKAVEQMISKKELLYSLYSCAMTIDDAKTELKSFVPLIFNFVQQYIKPSKSLCVPTKQKSGKDEWIGEITGIADIEENIWAPKLGLKGKIDVTVHTKSNLKKKIMPLELKTGRASFSTEHRGQVILYTMMMSEIGSLVDSGLLLYLREGIMKEIMTGNAERRDLMILRNQLVQYLEIIKQTAVDDHGRITAPTLPDPINHRSACMKCPYNTLCSAALRINGLDHLPESNVLKTLALSCTAHLKMEHIQYVFHWSGLLRMENAESHKDKIKVEDIWNLSPQQREENGNCLSNVQLQKDVKEVTNGTYKHIFTWIGAKNVNINEGEYLIVSCPERIAVAAGTVKSLSSNLVTLYLERKNCNSGSISDTSSKTWTNCFDNKPYTLGSRQCVIASYWKS